MTDIKTEIILCECYDLHHQMVVIHDTDDNLVYINVKSNVRGFWYRLKYLFGFIKYDFAEFIINEQDVPKFEAIIETLRKKTK